MTVGFCFDKIGLINVVREDGVERRDVARHAAHERSNQRRDAHTQQAGWIVVCDQRRQGHGIIQLPVRSRWNAVTFRLFH